MSIEEIRTSICGSLRFPGIEKCKFDEGAVDRVKTIDHRIDPIIDDQKEYQTNQNIDWSNTDHTDQKFDLRATCISWKL